jgi:hypothetical protein
VTHSPLAARRLWVRNNLVLIIGVGLFAATVAAAIYLFPQALAPNGRTAPAASAAHPSGAAAVRLEVVG